MLYDRQPARTIRQNSTEVVRISRTTFKERKLVDCRVYAQNDKGELVPTRKGLSVRVELFPILVAHLQRALDTLGIPIPDLDGEERE